MIDGARPVAVRHKTQMICVSLLLCVVLTVSRGCAPLRADASTVTFHFVDVGQGDAALITTPDGNILIDAGTNRSELALESYLKVYHVSRLAYVILTHPHEDHIGGADRILDDCDVGTLILPESTSDEVPVTRLREAADRNGCQVMTVSPGVHTFGVGALSLTIYAPEPTAKASAGENQNSLVVRAAYGGVSALYMGDAEADTEAALLEQFHDSIMNCDILKLGHHGSSTSTTEAFLDAVTPGYAIVSAGAGNAYGHPSAEVLTRLSVRGITCLRVDLDGSCRLTTDGVSLWVGAPGDQPSDAGGTVQRSGIAVALKRYNQGRFKLN